MSRAKAKAAAKATLRPALCADEPGGQKRALTIAFGYMPNNEPCAALFVGDSDEPILIPRDFLQVAVEQGWEGPDCPACDGREEAEERGLALRKDEGTLRRTQ